MPATYVPWTPVYNYGCGWRDCPECGPMIELEIERKHLKRVAESNPQIDQQSEWLAEVYGTGAERVQKVQAVAKPRPPYAITPAKRKAAKTKQKAAQGRIRVKRSLSEAKLNEAQREIDARIEHTRSLIRRFDEWDLRNEVWCELLHPNKQVATSERYATMELKVKHAFDRATGVLGKLARASTRDAGTSGLLEAA